jgi:5-methylcytosine-specific restriction protein A
MKRRRRTGLQRTKIFDAHGGKCCLCKLPIDTPKQKWILEHLTPLWLGGADDETNLAPAHYDCAINKTREEAPVKAKSDRIRARHIGIRKKSKFACSRNSKFKKKITGEVVLR